MAKGFLAGLKGIDAFGKVNHCLLLLLTRRHPYLTMCPLLDYRRRESEDAYWRSLYV